MARRQKLPQTGYGLSQALIKLTVPPITSQRAPTTTDYAQVGQIWIDIPNDDAYILTSLVANVATWINIGGGSGTFTNINASGFITAGGNITSTAGNISATAGSVSAGTTITAGTGISTTTGNITAPAGGLTVLGDITTTGGNFIANAGDLNLQAGDIFANNIAADTSPVGVNLIKSRANGVITSGDNLGIINFAGNDGTQNIVGAAIASISSGTIATDRIPADLQFYTHPDSITVAQQRMVINSAGSVTINEPDSGSSLLLDGATSATIQATGGANTSLFFVAAGSGTVAHTRSAAGVDVVLEAINSDNTNIASRAMVASSVGGTSAGDATFQALISGGQVYTFGIDNSTANDDFVLSKNAALGTANVLSFDGTSNAATFAAGITATTGNITATAGGFVASTAGQGITLGNTAKVIDGSGDPNGVVTAPQGSLYLNRTGSATNNRAFINTDGATAWTSITTAA